MKCCLKLNRRLVRSALLLATVSLPLPAMAENKFYNGPDGGLWNNPANWLNPGVPANGDYVTVSSTVDKTVTFDFSYAPPGLQVLDVEGSIFATLTLRHPAGGTMQVSSQEHIGYDGRARYI
jgi:hypothetical protein